MARMERIALADIRPDANNPRKDFGDLGVLAASFDVTPDRPGEPLTPPIVVQDGNVYRIVDGERRYRAMRDAGKVEDCLCMVFDDMSEASSVVAMMATDNKEELSDEERAQGIQQLLIFGVPERDVQLVANISEDRVRRVKRVVAKRAKPLQLSMADLFSLADVEDDDERTRLASLLDEAKPKRADFATGLRTALSRQEAMAAYKEFKAALLERLSPCDIVEDMPDDHKPVYWIYSIAELDEKLDAAEGDPRLKRWKVLLEEPRKSEYGPYFMTSRPEIVAPVSEVESGEGDAEQAKLLEYESDIASYAAVAKDNVSVWIASLFARRAGGTSAIDDAKGHPELADLREAIRNAAIEESKYCSDYWKGYNLDLGDALPGLVLMPVGDTIVPSAKGLVRFLSGRWDYSSGYYVDKTREFLDDYALLKRCGYVPSDTESELLAIAVKRLEEATAGDGDGEE